MQRLELFWPLAKPYRANYNNFGDNIEFYKNLNIGLEKGHNGIDILALNPSSTAFLLDTFPVYAAHDGIVTYTGIDSKEGYGIIIRTKEKFLDWHGAEQYWKTIYWHLKPPALVTVGQTIMVGDLLGTGDTTGLSKGPHLHFGLKPIAQGENDWTWSNVDQMNGYFGAVDPLPYMSPLTAYQLRGTLQKMAEMLQSISNVLAAFLKGRRA